MKTYTFRVSLPGTGRVWRRIELRADQTLESLNLKPKQTFLYLFDYGDEWRFRVRVHAVNEHADPDAGYPRLVESVGEAPPQYPDWDDEEDE